jgi:flagellin-like hook-associated protein FlgL
MNKEQLKKTLRPMIKECIKEVIFEEGILSSIISEVVKGTSQPLVESRQPTYQQPQVDYEAKQRAEKERRRKILDSIGRDAYNGVDLFEGTQPLKESRSTAPHGSKALDGIAPNDPGVNLAALGINTSIWSKLAGK